MNLPSIDLVVTAALGTARRFPLVLAASVLAAIAGIGLTAHVGGADESTRALAAATLGLPLLFALTLFGERRLPSASARGIVLAAGVAALATFWAAWPGWSSTIQALRFVQLSVAFHLLVAVLPYAGLDEPNGFWQYNKGLFLRFLTAWLYSAVLYAGLAIALLALDKLFGVTMPGESYGRLWIVIAFVFHTWFFLGGVSPELGVLEQRTDYPAGLRIFTQFVLVPIVALYLVILTAYLAKVVATRQWPSGWIGYLVSSVATVGILSWLLVRPLEERAEFAWVKTFTRGFYVVLMPAIAMLWLAIWKRIDQYGITERRYFLVVLSIWLAVIAVYYTVSRSRSIKLIPASLCALALLTLAGPTGAYAVSQASQMARLRGVLLRNDLLSDGRLRRSARDVSDADRAAISGGLRYLVETHGAEAIAAWLTDSLRLAVHVGRARPTAEAGDGDARAVMAHLHLEYVPAGSPGTGGFFTYYVPPPRGPIAIDGYQYAIRLSYWVAKDSLKVAEHVYLRLASDSTRLLVMRDGAPVLEIPFLPLIDSAAAYRRLNPNRTLPAEVMHLEVHSGSMAANVYLSQVHGTRGARGAKLTSFDGDLFLRIP